MPSAPARSGFRLEREPTSVAGIVRSTVAALPLIRLLARKEFHVRYRRASFGVLWAVALPLTQALVLAVVLGRVARFDVGVSLGVFIFAGTLPFSQLTAALGAATTSIVDNTQLSSRVYFPRTVLPLMVVGSTVYGLVAGLLALGAVTVIAGESLGPEVWILLPAVALTVVFASGLALVASALHVYFRDTKYVVAAGTTVWFYATPIFYPLDELDGTLRGLLVANPATGMVQLYRAALGIDVPSLVPSLLSTVGTSVVLVVVGVALHARWDRVFADLL